MLNIHQKINRKSIKTINSYIFLYLLGPSGPFGSACTLASFLHHRPSGGLRGRGTRRSCVQLTRLGLRSMRHLAPLGVDLPALGLNLGAEGMELAGCLAAGFHSCLAAWLVPKRHLELLDLAPPLGANQASM